MNASRNASLSPAVLFAACCLTFAAGSAQGVNFPNVPLESGAEYPPPNVMLILDDSTSMGDDSMPDTVPAVAPSNIADLAYTRNTLSYNPAVTYEAWRNWDGTRSTVGTTYTGARGGQYVLDTTDTNLANSTRTFHVPKPAVVDMAVTGNYYRWQILTGGNNMVRSEWGTGVNSNSFTTPATWPKNDLDSNSGVQQAGSFTLPVLPAGQLWEISVSTSGGTHGDNTNANDNDGDGANLLIQLGAAPSTSSNYASSNGSNNTESISVTGLYGGTQVYVGLSAASRYRDVDVAFTYRANNRCVGSTGSPTWINCREDLPPQRDPDVPNTLALEKVNYATWYTYHRTRMKVAKAGAAEAFYGLPSNLRIGYTTIHNDQTVAIPVGTDNGLFRATNKQNWFTALHTQVSSGSTPLRTGLAAVGEYYKTNVSATGPWGPEAGAAQLSCRQNFAILTTDGYWNTADENSNYKPTGNIDNTNGPNGYSAIAPYADNNSSTLADVAMHYWKNDLRDLDNNVPFSSSDPANWQHMVTFGISLGLQGNINPNALPSTKAGWGSTPVPACSDCTDTTGPRAIDDLLHASVNSRGKFIVANNAGEFQRGLLDAFTVVAERSGSASNVTANSTSLTTDTRVFQATYVSGTWKGELQAFDATSAGTGTVQWSASTGVPAPGSRNIFTWNTSATPGIAFPTSAQSTALDQSSRPIAPVNAANHVAYLKGDHTRERRFPPNGTLRNRDTALGDIVNSTPFYVADTNTLYVGSNDGFLRAINAATGAELFAYVPKGINLTDLGTLSHPSYQHAYFVDGPVVVSTQAQTPSNNYLVGALGRGGKGVFGLNVTNPATFSATNVLWEQQDADLGNVLGEPLIATMNGVGAQKVAIVGNGPNSDGGQAVLFVLNIATGAVLHEIQVDSSVANGLFAPRGWDEDGNGTVDFVYAADLLGRIWKFDFMDDSPSLALGGEPLFEAQSGQPMTAGLALARDPNPPNKRWVFFGTGSYMTAADPADDTVQSVYGVIDDDATVALTELREREILVVDMIDLEDDDDDDSTPPPQRLVRAFEPVGELDADEKGWYLDLDDPTEGERVVSRPQVRGTVLVFASRIPPVDNTCQSGGSGFLNALDAFSGTSTGEPYFDANGDGEVNDLDQLSSDGEEVPVGSIDLGIGMPTLPTIIDKLLIVGGSTGNLGSVVINPQGGVARRASWHEISGD